MLSSSNNEALEIMAPLLPILICASAFSVNIITIPVRIRNGKYSFFIILFYGRNAIGLYFATPTLSFNNKISGYTFGAIYTDDININAIWKYISPKTGSIAGAIK